MRWLILLLTCQVTAAAPLDDRFSVRVEGGIAFHLDGYTRLRQFDERGDRLDLRDDLDVRTWYGLSLETAWHFDSMHAISSAFDWNGFGGRNRLDREVTHEGATFAAGTQVSFNRSTWWRVQAWYHVTPWRNGYVAVSVLAGALMDFADVYVAAKPGPIAGQRDDHENFGTLAMPVPAIGTALELTPTAGLRLGLSSRGTWIEDMPTWHAGTKHSQAALDATVSVSYRISAVEFGAVAQHQLLYLEQNNHEDGNEFLLQGTQARLFVRVWL